MKAFHRLGAFDAHQLVDPIPHCFLGFLKSGVAGGNRRGSDLAGQIVTNGIGDHKIAVGQALHQRRGAQAVGPVVGEIRFAQSVEAGHGGGQLIVDP